MKLKELIIVENKKRTCNASSYISTENMISNYGGVVLSNSFNLVKGTLFNKNYILLSNIRPYFRKILFSNFEGCCSNDVLSIKVDSYKCDPKYLYYFFCSDGFINNYVSNCKGTKMPRGDKIYLLNLNFNLPNIEVQQHIVNNRRTSL